MSSLMILAAVYMTIGFWVLCNPDYKKSNFFKRVLVAFTWPLGAAIMVADRYLGKGLK